MIWAAVFVICMPDALRGPVCAEHRFEGMAGFTVCEIQRPDMRRAIRARLEAAGLGAASVDAGRCEPYQPPRPGVLM